MILKVIMQRVRVLVTPQKINSPTPALDVVKRVMGQLFCPGMSSLKLAQMDRSEFICGPRIRVSAHVPLFLWSASQFAH